MTAIKHLGAVAGHAIKVREGVGLDGSILAVGLSPVPEEEGDRPEPIALALMDVYVAFALTIPAAESLVRLLTTAIDLAKARTS